MGVDDDKAYSGDLVDLKRQRGTLRGRITQFKKYLDAFSDSSPSSLQIKEIKFRMSAAKEHFTSFNNLQSQIDMSSSDSDSVSNIEYVESFESLYFGTLALAESLVEDGTAGAGFKGDSSHKTVKLPQIKLPAFNGSYDDWLEFRNSFVTMIHNRTDLDPIQKFHYLRSSLSGTAIQVINALDFTDSNYNHAWELLETRFHNSRLLIHNHIKALFSIPSNKHESATHIRKLIDTVMRNLRALKSLGEPTDSWDTLIIYLTVSRLDPSTERDWENHLGTIYSDSTKKLKLDDLLTFLKNKSDALDMINANNKNQNKPTVEPSNKRPQKVHSYVVNHNNTCSKGRPFNNNKQMTRSCTSCGGNHNLYSCFRFLNLSCKDRIKFVDDKQLCRNCLRSGHRISDCTFGPCKQCNQKHNSLLHLADTDNNTDTCVHSERSAVHCADATGAGVNSLTALHSMSIDTYHSRIGSYSMQQTSSQTVLLCTALVEIVDVNKRVHTVKALLDNGSQHCFITDRLRRLLNAPYIQSTVQICGVSQSVTQSNISCDLTIRSKVSDYSAKVRCLVLQRITSSLPTTRIDTEFIRIPNNVHLADPTFHIPSEIDLLIGADLFWEILENNKMRLVSGPYLQNSKLGWLLSGPLNAKSLSVNKSYKVQCNFVQSIDKQLARFWELETVAQSRDVFTHDERWCEDYFKKTTIREADGRFSVRIPLKKSPNELGDSFNMAKNRFLSIERKLERSPSYKRMYCDFMREYEDLGHMTRLDKFDSPNYFLCHHGVLKEDSTTTKLRVVFDASAVTTSNLSLNDIQFAGPALQNDIFSILIRFRQYKYVACADIEKMFRMVNIQLDQRPLQLILWRDKVTDPLKVYQLNTVTYGTASAPYLSMRCIRELALQTDDEVIARVITDDVFVDDLITGHDNHQSLITICEKTAQVLQSGCFRLRKWKFNFETAQSSTMFTDEHTQNKTLGIGWHNDTDELYYTTKLGDYSNVSLTKRVILSTISQIYDPLGLLSPVVIIAKILLQKLWLKKLDWDSPVSHDITIIWHSFLQALKCLCKLKLPRHVMGNYVQHIELHIFSDASQSAYGACAYIRTYNSDSEVCCRLLCAKSKVAPLKSITIPRLELCGALIGARLYKQIVESLRMTFTKAYFWTDSTIVIGWMRMSPHSLKTFVHNRVVEINELTGDSSWLHVISKDNPADLLSRGLNLDSLINNSLWWNGPSYLQCSNNNNFSSQINSDYLIDTNNLPELKTQTINLTCITQSYDLFKFENYSSFSRLRRVGAYVLRFIAATRSQSERSKQETGSLSVDELNASERMLVIFAQRQSFPNIYDKLINNLPLKVNGKELNRISGLNVFIDKHKIIRVGGRLSNSSSFDYNKKHPILLCGKHHFTLLIIRHEHVRLCHAGPQHLLSSLRERWWPLSARNITRKTVRECIICSRVRGKTLTPLMGNLPSDRLDPGSPFMRTGVDYAGPMYILNRKGRGAKLIKAYICLFVCFLTRAVHLELASGLSTDDYILALKRFISRRGKPDIIYSDNGKNFVGAEKELSVFFNNYDNNCKHIVDFAASENIKFYFIPPYSPHFGGLWESGIRSCKHHLKRIIGNANLTYEECSTVLTQVEAVLNSRPLSPMSTDPSDLAPLTPGHFLVGRPLTALASENLADEQISRLNRYQRVEQLRQHFWQRWAKEYVSELQVRTKWKSLQDDIQLGSLVVVKEENLPPMKWKLGRVMKIYPGSDGVSRVADLRTASGTIRRSFSRICPLPVH